MTKRKTKEVNKMNDDVIENTEVETTEDVNVEAEAEAAEADATEKEAKADRRTKQITDPEGNVIARTDYIRDLWKAGEMTRREIRDHLATECSSTDGGHDVAYQIVFAATKDVNGGPSEAILEQRKAEKQAARDAIKAEKKAEKDAEKARKAAEKAAEKAAKLQEKAEVASDEEAA